MQSSYLSNLECKYTALSVNYSRGLTGGAGFNESFNLNEIGNFSCNLHL